MAIPKSIVGETTATMPNLSDGSVIFDGNTPMPCPNNQDVAWLQDHTTRLKE